MGMENGMIKPRKRLNPTFVCALLGFFGQTVCAWAGSSNSLMDIHPSGTLLAVANPDCGTVSLVDLSTRLKKGEIPVGKKPEGVTFIGSGKILAVAVFSEDALVLVDTETQKVIRRIPCADEPYGIVSSAKGDRVWVTHDYLGMVSEWETVGWTKLREIPVASFVRGLAVSSDEKSLFVTGFYNGRLHKVDLETGKVVDEWKGHSTDNLSRSLVLHPTRPKAYIPHVRSRIEVIDGSGSIFPQITVYSTNKDAPGTRRGSVAMDNFNGVLVVTNPWEVALTPDSTGLFAIYSATDDMNACRVLDDDYKEIEGRGNLIQVGRNPRAVRVSPDGKTVWVYAAMDFAVQGFDTQSLRSVAKVVVCEKLPDEQWVLGKYLFGSSRQPMSGPRWVSCFSCHPDGLTDGRVWHNPEGLRKTPPLFGMGHTHPLHWSADRDEVQDFEYTIRGRLMQGRGLINGPIPAKRGFSPTERKADLGGRSKDLDALAIYSNSFEVETLSPYSEGPGKLSEKAQRGKIHFESPTVGCVTCHSGPYYTDSNLKVAKVYDVGTGLSDPSEKMGPKYDTPSLIGVYRTAPYLHHGKAQTLVDVLTIANPEDKHGKTSHLKKEEVLELAEFLKSLPYELPPKQTANSVKYRLIKTGDK